MHWAVCAREWKNGFEERTRKAIRYAQRMRNREGVVSQPPRKDDELDAFLRGDSPLSRHYKEAGDEQPPAKVDAAILAAAQWAVGADSGKAKRPAGAHTTGGNQPGPDWWRNLFSRWAVPLASAAVVVVAATLTLMIERDPEMERIETHYDSVALNAPDKGLAETPAGLAEQEVDAVAQRPAATREPVAKKTAPTEPAQEKAKEAKAESAPQPAAVAPQRLEFRPVDEEAAAAAKDFIARRETANTAGRAEVGDAQPDAGIAADIASPAAPPVAVAALPAEDESTEIQESVVQNRVDSLQSQRDSDAVLAGDMPSAESSPDEALTPAPAMGLAGAQSSAALPAGDSVSSQSQSAGNAGTQFVPAPTVPVQPSSNGASSSGRDPDEWIADIEEQLALGNRELARAAVRNFRDRYPDYELPEALEQLLSANDR
jgi:resuscitation-promoting factor RpfA